MGTIYRAVRDDDHFLQTVAIKMLRCPYGDAATLQRFCEERQILASLEYPHIARLLDGGAWSPPGASEPQPYIVMEYIEGLPLITYCEQKKLAIRQRLALFRQICGALSYAHQRLVIHRDIKPANILVTADGIPKLLDFGVAKLLNAETGRGASARTRTGPQAITPDYASPEQVRGEAVSTATDIYSLGAVLYELLTGRRAHQLETYDPLEIARAICEGEVRPAGIDGDLDVIVHKAMQKEPGRRYQSAEQLSEDIRRFLDSLPILARRDTLGYRSMKFVRRHRAGVAAVAAVFVALVSGIVVSGWEAMRANQAQRTAWDESRRARQERDKALEAEQAATNERTKAFAERQRADAEAATAKAVSEFLENDVLAQAGSTTQAGGHTVPDPDLKVRTALDRAAARISGKFESRPLVEASIRQTIGEAYQQIGSRAEARPQLERALELRRRVLGQNHPDTLHTIKALAQVFGLLGDYPQAEALFSRAVEVETHILGPEHPNTASTMSDLANAYTAQGKYRQAAALLRRALGVERRTLGSEHPNTLNTMTSLGVQYRLLGLYPQAESFYSQAIGIERRVLGEMHPFTLVALSNLGTLYEFEGKRAEAESLLSKVLELRRRVLGPEHPSTLLTTQALAGVYRNLGRYQEAEGMYTRLLEQRRRLLGEEHPDTLATASNLGGLYLYQGRYAEAETMLVRVLEIRRRRWGDEHPGTLTAQFEIAELRRRQGDQNQAEQLLIAVLDVRRRVIGPAHRDTLAVLASLGRLRLEQHQYAEAERLLREALGLYDQTAPGDWSRYDTQALLGASLAGQSRFAEAEPLMLGGYQGLSERGSVIPAGSHRTLESAGERIVQLYESWKRPESAAQWRMKIHMSEP